MMLSKKKKKKKKKESNGSFTKGKCRLLRHCCWSLARRYTSTIFTYTQPRLHNSNINKSNKRKWFHIKTKNARNRIYPIETITDADDANDLVLLANTPAKAESSLSSLEQSAESIVLYVNTNKTEFAEWSHIHLKWQTSKISGQVSIPWQQHLIDRKWCQHTLSEGVDWLPIDHIETDLSDKIKRDFFKTVALSTLLYGRTTRMLTKNIAKS